jgi:hypothetical protein
MSRLVRSCVWTFVVLVPELAEDARHQLVAHCLLDL